MLGRMSHFADRLAASVEEKGAPLCVGLDPMPDRLPDELRGPDLAASYELFCRGIVDAVADVARGDIPSTAAGYAAAFAPLADATTVSPYMGRDSLEPFLERGLGLFVLVKTSNPGSADLQDLPLADGRPLWHHVAGFVDELGSAHAGASGLSSVGAVVGATHPGVVETARKLMPRAVLLILGVGAQGASLGEVAPAFVQHPAGGLVSISRPILYAYEKRGGDWRQAAAAEARSVAEQLGRTIRVE